MDLAMTVLSRAENVSLRAGLGGGTAVRRGPATAWRRPSPSRDRTRRMASRVGRESGRSGHVSEPARSQENGDIHRCVTLASDLVIVCIVGMTRPMAESASARPPGADTRRPSPPPPLARVVPFVGHFAFPAAHTSSHTSTFIHNSPSLTGMTGGPGGADVTVAA